MSRILLIDTETGGLDPEKHSILSLAAVVWTPQGIDAELELFVKEPEIFFEDEAIQINRIDVDWISINGLAPEFAVDSLESFVDANWPEEDRRHGILIGGHNVSFDVLFLKRLYRLARRDYKPTFSHRLIDTASVIQLLILAGRLPLERASSDQAFEYFGISVPEGQRHTALGDARATASLLNKLVEMVR